MNASDLHPALLHHIVNTLEWNGLRPLQESAIEPILRGRDALLLAPTAGGKTEAACFPLLTRAANENWRNLSVLYVCPLRALLNNLEPRLHTYAEWVGRRAQLWHGDTGKGKRQKILEDPPDVLLTTPESLEGMLVSTKVNPREHFAYLRAVVVDEVHAFAGDDRGWHLLAVLERLERLAGHSIQRIGLSATVGNPAHLLSWLQGSAADQRPAEVVAPEMVGLTSGRPPGDVTLDYVGSITNAAKVISLLHAGEKRLVFCESRREVEELARELRAHEVTTFVSHSSLSVDQRRRAEQAFAEQRDCVIVSTSTLELGIDVGDLDRVIQVNAPNSVASFLQRLGRTGRRPGTLRNTLFLTTTQEGLLRAAGLLLLWARGYVEPVLAPRSPRHIAAQQLLAICLQEGRIGLNVWREWWNGLPIFDEHVDQIVSWLVESHHLESDAGMLFIGPEAEQRFGRRNFIDLVSVFTANPEFTVIEGRHELGTVDPIVLTRKVAGPRIIVLAARSWQVTHIDWKRRRCYVEPSDIPARMRWVGDAAPLSFSIVRAEREVVLGVDPDVAISERAIKALEEVRGNHDVEVSADGFVVLREGDGVHWWTWAGARANATLIAGLPGIAEDAQRPDNFRIRLRGIEAAENLLGALKELNWDDVLPSVSPAATAGLKFSEVLPPDLAVRTIAERLADHDGAQAVAGEPLVWNVAT
ncbi:DEAD/DEAH box helicase [Mycobacterium intracellulare subsp. intracellulare]|uniref:DEAD/DEAH box helicase n=1 Tax=Mycobacterium intracellulare TaxID=1767 RepID=UPI000305E218|nr:DEAD/DEAH box helicase [Mycobacterium intracellulare]UGU05766.1 DEAD/DEAH box helicase [Mycobacterium intracellulare subsp. intracellulare]BCO59622.1 ATP-dependent helicase [Mycobacterium intracellulare]BCO96802.1 ATP-dependent helicase [Mycobacterium intracellulare]